MAATFFTVPIASPAHVVLPSIELASSGQVRMATTTPDLFQGLSSSSGTLPQPIYPPPSSSSSGQGKTNAPQTQPTSAPSSSPTSPPTDQSQESWVKKMWERYKGASN